MLSIILKSFFFFVFTASILHSQVDTSGITNNKINLHTSQSKTGKMVLWGAASGAAGYGLLFFANSSKRPSTHSAVGAFTIGTILGVYISGDKKGDYQTKFINTFLWGTFGGITSYGLAHLANTAKKDVDSKNDERSESAAVAVLVARGLAIVAPIYGSIIGFKGGLTIFVSPSESFIGLNTNGKTIGIPTPYLTPSIVNPNKSMMTVTLFKAEI